MGAPLQHRPNEAGRLTPEMSSRKLKALDFIKRYFAQWGYSPTLGEVGASLGVTSKRAHDLVHQLARDKMIEHVSGKTRGIVLVDRGEELSEADVLLRLSAMGWTIRHGATVVLPPSASSRQALTEKGLHELPELDHAPGLAPPHTSPGAADEASGTGTNGQEKQSGRGIAH